LSTVVKEFSKLGLICAFIGVLVLFASFNSGNSGFGPNPKINWGDMEKTLTNGSGSNGYSQDTMALVIFWVLLMIAGSYLLVHIHFRVLREEKM